MILNSEIADGDLLKIINSKKSIFSTKRKNNALIKSELLHLPYYVYSANYKGKKEEHKIRIGVDAIEGNATFFTQDSKTKKESSELIIAKLNLSEKEACKIAAKFLQSFNIEMGLKAWNKVKVDKLYYIGLFYYPYWVSYFKNNGSYDFKVVDGISGRIGGNKIAKTILKTFNAL